MTVSYGMRANEQAVTTLVANVAVLAATTIPTPTRKQNIKRCVRVTTNLSAQPGTQSITSIEADLADAQTG